jgi:group I intron endonuclease
MIIYLIENTVNHKLYIGKTVRSLAERWNVHVGAAIRRNSRYVIHQAIRKYGKDAFTVTHVMKVNTLKDLSMAECLCIAAFKAAGFELYNRTGGGEGTGVARSEESKLRSSLALKAVWTRSPMRVHQSQETRDKISRAMKRHSKQNSENGRRAQSFRIYGPMTETQRTALLAANLGKRKANVLTPAERQRSFRARKKARLSQIS